MKVLLNPCYFGSISYWLAIQNADELVFEVCDNYQKQTLRNRCNILAANGKLSLTIPVNYSQKNRQAYKDVQIAAGSDWQEQHLKSLESAYKMSPFFEFYIDDIKFLFLQNWTNLMEYNFECLKVIARMLEIPLDYSITEKYIKDTEGYQDFRLLTDKNAPTPYPLQSYTQVFTGKFGFTRDLCILDLLFNEGPNTENFLKKHIIG